MAGQGKLSRNRLRTPKNDLGCLLNRTKRLRNVKVMILGVLLFATGKDKKGVPEKAPGLARFRH